MKDSDETAPRRPAVKICGITRREDAVLAEQAGAEFLGIILVPDTPRVVTASEAAEVTTGCSLPVVAVLADLPPEVAVREGRVSGAAVLQLHGEEPPEYLEWLKSEGPWALWKALRVRGPEDVARGIDLFGTVADGLLLDGWHPRQRGGTGTVFSWGEMKEVRGGIPPGLTLVLAGGLTPQNVGEAIHELDPDVVDVSSGVESSPRIKDPEKTEAFIRNAHVAGKEEVR